jgi:DHA1 family bicyclomycin/chloramphenicol resistance-like MFS transporter
VPRRVEPVYFAARSDVPTVNATPRLPAEPRASLSFVEFVSMMAATMALHAVAIDAMLPALTLMGRDFGVTADNRLQWIVTIFVMGVGAGQLIYGPLADRFGRRRVLLTGLVLYIVLSLVASFATSLTLLLTARAAQGFSVAATSVVSRSIVRDRYSGSTMARVMSTIFLVFLIVPVVAPSVGQALLFFVSWRGIFRFLAILGTIVTLWVALRLPETLRPENRRPLSAAHLSQAARYVVTEPTSILYTLGMTAMFGSLLAYVSTVPQIFAGAFHAPQLMAVTFAVCAGTMGVASFLNSRIVERVGMHRISHIALVSFIVITAVHATVAYQGTENVLTFALLQSLTMGCFGLAVSNFGAIAMQPMGAIAGSAASIQGVISTIGGAAVGSLIGQQWAGSVLFLPAGAFCCGIAALACVLIAEKARLFRNRTEMAA